MRIRNRRALSAENMISSMANSNHIFEASNNAEMQSSVRLDLCSLNRTVDTVEDENGDSRGKTIRLNKAERIQQSRFEGMASPVSEDAAGMMARIWRNDMGSSGAGLISTEPSTAPVHVVKAARSTRPYPRQKSGSSRFGPRIRISTEIIAGGDSRGLPKPGKQKIQKNSAISSKDNVNCNYELLHVENRCRRRNGRGWRCHQRTLAGYSLCEYHLGKNRLRNINKPCADHGGLQDGTRLGNSTNNENDLEFSVQRNRKGRNNCKFLHPSIMKPMMSFTRINGS